MNKAEKFYALDSALGMSDKDFNFVRSNRYTKYVYVSRNNRNSNSDTDVRIRRRY